MSNKHKQRYVQPQQHRDGLAPAITVVDELDNNVNTSEELEEEIVESGVVEDEGNFTEEEQDMIQEAIDKRSVDTGIDVNEIMNQKAPDHPTYQHMYRVRLDWERPDTQVFSSPDFETAKAEALKHEGYKIFVDDDGVMVEDPWANRPTPVKDTSEKPVIHPIGGKSIELIDTKLYRTAIDRVSFKTISATVYFYDSTVINGRARVTAEYHDFSKEVKNPNLILGYINV